MRKILSSFFTIIFLFNTYTLCAQQAFNKKEQVTGEIYVGRIHYIVIGIFLVALFLLSLYLFKIERRITALENK